MGPRDVLINVASGRIAASLSEPETAVPGATIVVELTVHSGSADQRVSIAQANQATFTWITAVRIAGDSPLSIILPEEPGMYELRFLDIPGRSVLARRKIRVE